MRIVNKHFIFILTISLISCKKEVREYDYKNIDFKEEMRQFVIGISNYAKNINSDFLIIPQNGVELVTQNGRENNNLHQGYSNAIDAQGQEGLNYGYDTNNIATDGNIQNHLKYFLDLEKNSGKEILVTDYAYSTNLVSNSYNLNDSFGYIGYVSPSIELDIIQPNVHNLNNDDVLNVQNVKNFLYIINSHNYYNKQVFLSALEQTNYDLIIIDLFFNGTPFTPQEIARLKHKQNGGQRKVIAYISIGEAENYRYYWNSQWDNEAPVWLEAENSNWQGNFKVKYWEKDWQNIIYGNNSSYVKKVLNAGFDGAYLDIVDAFQYFEDKYGIN